MRSASSTRSRWRAAALRHLHDPGGELARRDRGELPATRDPVRRRARQYAHNARGKIAGDTEGLLKLIVARDTRKLIGVHVIGERATELVHVGQAIMHLNGGVDTLIDMVFNYPSLAEAYKYAAYDCLGRLAAKP
jgi:hypothetical protein